jgi:hypothetical protein
MHVPSFSQGAFESCCIVDLGGGATATSAEQLGRLLPVKCGPEAGSGTGPELLPAVDHLYPHKSTDDSATPSCAAVLYAPLGAACTAPLHAALKEAVQRVPGLQYALRLVPPSSPACQVRPGHVMGGLSPVLGCREEPDIAFSSPPSSSRWAPAPCWALRDSCCCLATEWRLS